MKGEESMVWKVGGMNEAGKGEGILKGGESRIRWARIQSNTVSFSKSDDSLLIIHRALWGRGNGEGGMNGENEEVLVRLGRSGI